jgi:hypothetical protein
MLRCFGKARATATVAALLSCAAVGALSACGEPVVIISAAVTRSDSAGVAIVTLEDSLNAHELISATDTVTLRGAPEDLFANNPQAVLPLRDGRTLLSDGRVLASFDTTGSFIGVVMSPGQGPGELSFLASMWQTADDSIWVVDASARRLSRLGPDLRVARSIAYPQFGERRVSVWASLQGDTMAVSEYASDPEDRSIGLYANESRLGTWVIGSTSVAVGAPRKFSMSQRFPDGVLPPGFSLSQPFSPSASLRTYGGCMLHGYANRWEFSLEAPDSTAQLTTVARLRAPRDSAPLVTAERKEAYIQRNVAEMPEQGEIPRAQYEKALREHSIFPDRIPSFGRVLISSDGAIWVQRYRDAVESEKDQWMIVDMHGTRAYRFQLPIGSRLLAVRPQAAFVASRDADDVETQRWLRLPQLDSIRPIPACRNAR